MASSRFPGKPLADIMGIPMIEHVRRRVQLCPVFDEIVVATCDKEIYDTVTALGGEVVMTSDKHERCTDRVAEAVQNRDADIVVNVQGDEPLVVPEHLEVLVTPLLKDQSLECSNLIAEIPEDMSTNVNLVKIVFDNRHRALYFSREPIPSNKKSGKLYVRFFRQLGIIAFRQAFLERFLILPPTPLEAIESCDMMRAVEHGIEVRVVEVDYKRFGVDTLDDLKLANEAMSVDPLFERYR